MGRRINAEKPWWTDPRRFELAERLGSQALADGVALNAWKLSQDFWANGRKKIPLSVFRKLERCEDLLAVGLAVEQGEFAYVKGSRQFHEWILQKQESGRKGGLSIRKKTSKREANAKQTESETEASFSFSSSVSVSKNKDVETVKPTISVEERRALNQTWLETLSVLGIQRTSIRSTEEIDILRAVKAYGIEHTRKALLGARFEKGSKEWNPADHATTYRILFGKNKSGAPIHDKLANLAEANGPKEYRLVTDAI